MNMIKDELLVGGIRVNVYKRSGTSSEGPVAVLFLLHGRLSDSYAVESVANQILTELEADTKKDLWIVSFDHRNHGSRLLEDRSNDSWDAGNPLHALDMYSIQHGTSRDVSFLIDFLPIYLFPNEPSRINAWGVAGISLGGHSTWICLAHEPRLELGIPIIGCPDYKALMKYRAQSSNILYDAPFIPPSLTSLIEQADPVNNSQRFIGKKILVLSGKEDKLVPWSASNEFISSLNVGVNGILKVVVVEGIGHSCTDSMVSLATSFVSQVMLT